MRLALLMAVIALVPAASLAQPGMVATAQSAAPAQSNSSLDVPIENIAASSSGRAVLDKDFPGLRTQTMYGAFKALSLNQIAAMSSGRITPDMLAQAQTDLSALSFKPVASVQQTDALDLDPVPTGSQASLSASYPK